MTAVDSMDQSGRHLRFVAALLMPVSVLGLLVIIPSAVSADRPQPRSIKFTDRLPYGQKPILYDSSQTDDRVATLNQRLDAGEILLENRPQHGYLRSLLEALNVPVESQLLVFSKTALNTHLVEPKNPRAIYFNDDVYVAWVPGAATIELAAIDPAKGMNFYLLKQQTKGTVRLQREGRCLTCHAGTTTLHVPGPMVRSFLTDRRGKPVVGYSQITHNTDVSKRWGGWYVTGRHGTLTHHGNVSGADRIRRHKHNPALAGNVTDLTPYFDLSKHLSPHSDVVAHLVLDHQAHGQNLLTRVNYESRLRRRSDAEERLLRYLLFVDESPLAAPVRGTSGFAAQFEKQGRRDGQGRSLREFDLTTRLFKYRLSYLIQTRAFDGLPADAKTRLYRRLWDVLTGQDPATEFQKFPPTERHALIEIVRATKTDLPKYWIQ